MAWDCTLMRGESESGLTKLIWESLQEIAGRRREGADPKCVRWLLP